MRVRQKVLEGGCLLVREGDSLLIAVHHRNHVWLRTQQQEIPVLASRDVPFVHGVGLVGVELESQADFRKPTGAVFDREQRRRPAKVSLAETSPCERDPDGVEQVGLARLVRTDDGRDVGLDRDPHVRHPDALNLLPRNGLRTWQCFQLVVEVERLVEPDPDLSYAHERSLAHHETGRRTVPLLSLWRGTDIPKASVNPQVC